MILQSPISIGKKLAKRYRARRLTNFAHVGARNRTYQLASKRRGHTTKREVCSSGILSRVPTSALVRPARDALFYEVLASIGYEELEPLKQCWAILFAQKYCEYFDCIDSRSLHNAEDYRLQLIKERGLPEILKQLKSIGEMLGDGKKKQKDVPIAVAIPEPEPPKPEPVKEIDLGAMLTDLLQQD